MNLVIISNWSALSKHFFLHVYIPCNPRFEFCALPFQALSFQCTARSNRIGYISISKTDLRPLPLLNQTSVYSTTITCRKYCYAFTLMFSRILNLFTRAMSLSFALKWGNLRKSKGQVFFWKFCLLVVCLALIILIKICFQAEKIYMSEQVFLFFCWRRHVYVPKGKESTTEKLKK